MHVFTKILDQICFVCKPLYMNVSVRVCVADDLAHFNLWEREDVVKAIITVSLSLITAH